MKKEKNVHGKITRLCFAAVFAALICVATRIIQVPAPYGYMHLGDCFVLMGAWVLGPVYGFAAGAIGSALADLTSPFAIYAVPTFIIKGLMSSLAAVIMRLFVTKAPKLRSVGFFISGLAAEIFMVGGYFLFETLFLGLGIKAAFGGVVRSSVQGAFGLLLGVVLIRVIEKTGLLKKFHTHAV